MGEVGPAPSVSVAVHIMSEPREADDILEVVPSHAAYRVKPYHSGDNDAHYFDAIISRMSLTYNWAEPNARKAHHALDVVPGDPAKRILA